MSTDPSPSEAKLPIGVVVALVIFGLLTVTPTLMFLKHGATLFGDHAVAKLLLVSSMGSALSLSICTKGAKKRLLALLPGIVTGIGVPMGFMSYVAFFQRTFLLKVECVFILMITCFPGLILYVLLCLDTPDRQSSEE